MGLPFSILILLILIFTFFLTKHFGQCITLDDFDTIKNDPERWQELYDFYEKIAVCDGSNDNTILLWSRHCVLLCDGEGRNRRLDRLKNQYDVGLGYEHFENSVKSGDHGPFLGDPCNETKTVIPHFGRQDYVKICNEELETEVMSLEFSYCPSGNDHHDVETTTPGLGMYGITTVQLLSVRTTTVQLPRRGNHNSGPWYVWYHHSSVTVRPDNDHHDVETTTPGLGMYGITTVQLLSVR